MYGSDGSFITGVIGLLSCTVTVDCLAGVKFTDDRTRTEVLGVTLTEIRSAEKNRSCARKSETMKSKRRFLIETDIALWHRDSYCRGGMSTILVLV